MLCNWRGQYSPGTLVVSDQSLRGASRQGASAYCRRSHRECYVLPRTKGLGCVLSNREILLLGCPGERVTRCGWVRQLWERGASGVVEINVKHKAALEKGETVGRVRNRPVGWRASGARR